MENPSFCIKCGGEIALNYQFCPNCGMSVNYKYKDSAKSDEFQRLYTDTINQNLGSTEKIEKNSWGKRQKVIVGISVVGFIVLLFLNSLLFRSNNEESVPNSEDQFYELCLVNTYLQKVNQGWGETAARNWARAIC